MAIPTSYDAVRAKNPTNLSFIPNDEIARREISALDDAARANQPAVASPEQIGLNGRCNFVWERNKRFREQTGVEEQILRNLRARKAKYDPDKLSKILASGQSNIFAGVTGTICRGGESWLSDVMGLSDRKKNFILDPTPIPDLPPNLSQSIAKKVMQEWVRMAQEHGINLTPEMTKAMAEQERKKIEAAQMSAASTRTDRMSTKIQDQFIEGGFYEALSQCLYDITTNKAAIIKGPVMRMRKVQEWEKNSLGNRTEMKVVDKLVWTWQRTDPLDIYPSAGMTTMEDGDLVERVRFYPQHLELFLDVPGFDYDAIKEILDLYGETGYRETSVSLDNERSEIEDRGSDSMQDSNGMIDGKEFYLSVMGRALIESNITMHPKTGQPILPLKFYQCNVIQVAQKVIFYELDYNPMGTRPYSKTGWAAVPGSFYYQSIPELMEDLQKICNAAVRALVRNMGIASGPQVVLNDINRIAKGQNITSLHPWKIWQFVNYAATQLKAIEFMQPESRAAELIGVYKAFAALANEWTGIPSYQVGNDDASGAGRTARGLSMLMSSSARGIKMIIAQADREMFSDQIMKMFNMNMQFDEDESIKGDAQVRPRGIMGLIVKEQIAATRMQFLAQTANPIDSQIIGVKRRAKILREAGASAQLEPDDVAPTSEEELDELVRNMAMQAQLQAAAGAKPGR